MADTAAPTRRRVTDSYDEDPVLADYLLVVWKRAWMVLAAAVVCGAMAFAWSWTSPTIYEASAKMVVSAPKTTQAGEVAPVISVATVRAMLDNQSLAAQIIKEFRLDAAPFRLTPQRFLGAALTIETPRDTSVVVLRVRLASRDLPARVANRLAALASALADRLSQEETLRARDYIKTQLEQSRAHLDDVEAKLADFQKVAQIDALKKDVQAELWQRSGLLELQVDIAAERAALAKAEEELAKRKPVGTFRRTIDSDPALMEAAKETSPAGGGLLGLEVKSEYPSAVYEKLDQQIAESRTKLSSMEKKRAELIDRRKLDSGQLENLNLLNSRQAHLDRLKTEYSLAKEVYVDVATRYEQARLQVAGRSAQLQLLDAAWPSDRPVGPKVLRNTAAAALAGLVFAAVLVLLTATVAERRTPAPPPVVGVS